MPVPRLRDHVVNLRTHLEAAQSERPILTPPLPIDELASLRKRCESDLTSELCPNECSNRRLARLRVIPRIKIVRLGERVTAVWNRLKPRVYVVRLVSDRRIP